MSRNKSNKPKDYSLPDFGELVGLRRQEEIEAEEIELQRLADIYGETYISGDEESFEAAVKRLMETYAGNKFVLAKLKQTLAVIEMTSRPDVISRVQG